MTLIYSVSYFNLGSLELCLGVKPPVATGLCLGGLSPLRGDECYM